MPCMLHAYMVVLFWAAPASSHEAAKTKRWAHPFAAEDDAAVSWLQTHSRGKDGPDMSDLNELQAENPESYAIVKALLVKNSLGLIRRRTPEMSESSVEAFAAAGEEKAKAEDLKRGFFGWKPTDDSNLLPRVFDKSEQEEHPISEDKQVQHEWIAEEKDGFAAPHVDFNDEPEKSQAEEKTNDIFSKGLTQAKASSSVAPTKANLGAISSSSYLKDFSWNSDDDEEKPAASAASEKASAPTPADENPYKKFLS